MLWVGFAVSEMWVWVYIAVSGGVKVLMRVYAP